MNKKKTISQGTGSKGITDKDLYFKKVADYSPNLLFVTALEKGEIVYVNNRITEVLGYDPQNIYENGTEIFRTAIHPDDLEIRLENLANCKQLEDDEESEVEVRFLCGDNSWHWYKITEKIFEREEDGTVSQVISTAQNIHEQKISEEKLLEKHRRLNDAQAIGNIGSFERELPGDLFRYSEEFYHILGLEPRPEERFTLQEFLAHVHPDDRETYRAAIDHTHATGEPLDIIHRIVRRDGNVRQVHRRAAITKNEKGTPVRVYGTVQDITDRIKFEKENKRFETLMRATEKVAGTGSYEADLLLNQIYFSDGLFRLFGEKPGSFIPTGEWLAGRSHPEDNAKIQKILENAAETKEPYTYTRRIIRKDGQERIFEAQGTVITDIDEKAVKFIGLVQDITERKEAEEELRKSEENSRNLLTVLQNAPDSYLVLNPDLNIVLVSDAYLKATYTKRQEIIGKYIFDIFPDNPAASDASSVKKLKASLQKVLSSGKPNRLPILQYDVKDPNGAFEEKYWSPNNSPVLDAEGDVLYIIHRAFDITEIIKNNHGNTNSVNETEMLKTSLEEIRQQAVQIQEGKALLQSIFDASPYSIILLDILYDKEGEVEDFRFAMLNAFNFEQLGFSKDLVGKRAIAEFPMAVENGILDQLKRTAKTGIPADFETRYDGDGLNHLFRFRANKMNDQLVITSEDVGERKKYEETIQQMLNGSISAITILESIRDKQGNIIDFRFKGGNKAAEILNGVSTEEIVGKSLLKLFPGIKNGFLEMYIEVAEKGKSMRTQRYYNHEHFDNWFDVSAIKNGDGIILTYLDITEQKKAEQELLKLKEQLAQTATDKYRKIINSMDQGFCLLELIYDDRGECIDYRYLETNPVFAQQSGIENALGRTIKEIVPDSEPLWMENYSRVARTGKSVRFDNYAEGLERWFDVYAFKMDSSEEHQVAVIFKDITERKEAEERQTFLLKLNDALRPLADPEEIQFTAMNILGSYLDVNRTFYSEVVDDDPILHPGPGYFNNVNLSPEEVGMIDLGPDIKKKFLKGQTVVIEDVIKEIELNEKRAKAINAMQVRSCIGVPLLRNKKLQAVVRVHQSTPRRWTQAEISLVEEVTQHTAAAVERARAQTALRLSQERLQKVLTIETVGVLFFDAQSNFLDANDAFLSMIGYNREEFQSGELKTEDFTLPDWMSRTREALKEMKERGLFSPYEKELVRPDGTRWWGLFAGKRLNDKEFVEFVVDITEAKKTEEALIKAKDEAEAATKAKENFVSTMSHEIRTPLNAVIGLTNLLLEQNPRENQKENLDSLSFSAQNLLTLINDILDFSKLEAGKGEIEQNVFDLSGLIKSLQQLYEPQAKTKWTNLYLDLDGNIPELIVTDQLKLSQILHNLMSNAVKFTKNGRIDLSVNVNHKEEDVLWLDFAVEDTGIGISEKKLDFIFEKFSQAESSTVRQYGGTGLGLTITKLLLELMGSEIKVQSREGKGSKFYFSLPVRMATTAQKNPVKEELHEDLPFLREINLMVVEDVEINRNILLQFLRNWWDIQPDEAVNGKEAVEMAGNKKYDIILMDVRMPVMDGYEATSQIRKINGYKDIPIIALTADKNQELEHAKHDLKFDDLLTKPFDPAELKNTILSHLKNTFKRIEEVEAGKIGKESMASRANQEDKNLLKEEQENSTSSFEIIKYVNLAGDNPALLEKLLHNAIKAMVTYKQEFSIAATEDDGESLSNLIHKNTTSVHYLQANNLASQIDNYRELLKNPVTKGINLKKQEEIVLNEFEEIIEGLIKTLKNLKEK